MNELNFHISQVLIRHFNGDASEADEKQLEQWLKAAPANRAFYEHMQSQEGLMEKMTVYNTINSTAAWEKVNGMIDNPASFAHNTVSPARVSFIRAAWVRYAAILLLVAGTCFMLYQYHRPNRDMVLQPPAVQQDIPAGSSRAILTLADGSTIVLDSAGSGQLAMQGNTQISKLDAGSLAYNASNSAPSPMTTEILYNTISTPKGGEYRITLPDGSNAWLNAASSIQFPTAFTGKERRVTITGEVYLEVAANSRLPFKVNANGTEVQVLGTAFNVNAYLNEPSINTTLMEGAVRIHAYGHVQTLIPGQQAQVASKQIALIKKADTDKVSAWKNGLFNFEGASLEVVMRQLERWYDIEVIYEKGIPDIRFVGELSRSVTLAGLLRVLEMSKVHFRIEKNRRLVVLP